VLTGSLTVNPASQAELLDALCNVMEVFINSLAGAWFALASWWLVKLTALVV
jgi:hypothetical protein